MLWRLQTQGGWLATQSFPPLDQPLLSSGKPGQESWETRGRCLASFHWLGHSMLAMSEFLDVCKHSFTQAISPQYLRLFTSNWVQRFLRGLGIFVHTLSFVKNVCLDQKYTQFFVALFFANCWSINILWFLFTVTSQFNKGTNSILDQLLNGMYRLLIGTFLQPPNYIYGPKMIFLKHLSSLVHRLS